MVPHTQPLKRNNCFLLTLFSSLIKAKAGKILAGVCPIYNEKKNTIGDMDTGSVKRCTPFYKSLYQQCQIYLASGVRAGPRGASQIGSSPAVAGANTAVTDRTTEAYPQ